MSDETRPIDPTSYRLRANAFGKPRLYRLTEDALTWQEEGEKLDGVFYDDIAEVRMTYSPSRVATNRFRTRIIFRQGGSVDLTNTDYRGFAEFAEQNAEYCAFITELNRRLAAKGKGTVFTKGSGTLAYALNAAMTVFVFAMIALAFVLLVAWGLMWIAMVKLAIVIFFVPTLVRFMRRAKPARYDPLNLSSDVLPAV